MFVTYRIGFCYSSSQCELVLGPKGSKWVEARTGTYWNGCKYAEFSAPSPVGQPLRYDVGCVWTTCSSSLPLERFSYDLEMKTREQNRNKKPTEIERFDWFNERIQTHVGKKQHARELSRNQRILCFDAILQHDWPIEQCLLHFTVFFGGENEESMFWPFHLLADKTNNEHLPKPFFKVKRKSLYRSYCTR